MIHFLKKLFCGSEIDQFKKNWSKSAFAQFLLPDINNAKLKLGKEDGFLASIAYLAWHRGYDYTLDGLMEVFQIRGKSTGTFKARLKENWLEKDSSRR